MRHEIRKATAATAITMLVMAGCSTNQDSSGSASGTANGVLEIGSVHSLTGPLAALGEAVQGGLSVAVRQINDAGGVVIGNKHYIVKLVSGDDQSDPSQAGAIVQGLIRNNGVKFIFGPDATQTVGPALAVAAENGVGLFSSATQVIQDLNSGPSSLANRFTIGVGIPIADWVAAGVASVKDLAPNIKKVAILLESQASFDPWVAGYQRAFKAAGIQVRITLRYDSTTANFLPLLTRIKAAGVDALVTGNSSVPIQDIAGQMSELGNVARVLYGTGGAANICLTANGGHPATYSCAYLVPGGTDPATGLRRVTDWFKAYKTVNGKSAPASFASAAPFYAVPLKMLVAAMEKVGSVTNVQAIVKQLVMTTGQGLAGPISFNANHQIVEPIYVCNTRGGSTVSCDSVHLASSIPAGS